MNDFLDYDDRFPHLVVDILEYFDINNGKPTVQKSVIDFCEKISKKYISVLQDEMIQPEIIVKICERLYHENRLSIIYRGGSLNIKNNYGFVIKDKRIWNDCIKYITHYYNCLVYGFEYIYKVYKNIVLPIVAHKGGIPHLGSCFKYATGIITARHCLTDGDNIAIKGYSAERLNSAQIYVSENPNIDIAFIDTKEPVDIFCSEPHVLEDVLVMGYPMIPRFLDFCTAEKATISTVADLRMTPSRGSIVAMADELFTKDITKLMLITAKIRGGNSGGPVINKYGLVVGVSFSDAKGEGDSYDDLGYGIACPMSVFDRIINEKNFLKVKFVDYIE